MNNDTPLTDEQINEGLGREDAHVADRWFVSADFARYLERYLTTCKETLAARDARIKELEDTLARCAADTERRVTEGMELQARLAQAEELLRKFRNSNSESS